MIKGKFLLSYLDFYVYFVSVFIGLFILAFAMISNEQKKGNIIDPAEFIIEMVWTDGSPNDVDLWVRAPDNSITYFSHKDSKVVTLDRDDLGINNSTVIDGKTYGSNTRREVISIRKIIPGTYTVNCMMYANRNDQKEPIKITIRRLNPYVEVTEKTLELQATGEEQTAVNFDLDEQGNVSNMNDSYVSLFRVVK
ncbi:hypothetical protein EVB79_064 [Rhizobium phage RHph_N3_13]|nr:hypothetical protein EVB79_064 [Rhizobium phage RHph_N3_13]QIG69890.1 hypothetical protein F67_I3_11_064 [Rhizobium phage RHph_I3_11]